MRLESKTYLEFFSYMSAPGYKQQGRFRAAKAGSYIPVLGSLASLVFSIACFIPDKKATHLKRKEDKIVGGFLALRATLSIIPPLLLIVEATTTAVDAIFRFKR